MTGHVRQQVPEVGGRERRPARRAPASAVAGVLRGRGREGGVPQRGAGGRGRRRRPAGGSRGRERLLGEVLRAARPRRPAARSSTSDSPRRRRRRPTPTAETSASAATALRAAGPDQHSPDSSGAPDPLQPRPPGQQPVDACRRAAPRARRSRGTSQAATASRRAASRDAGRSSRRRPSEPRERRVRRPGRRPPRPRACRPARRSGPPRPRTGAPRRWRRHRRPSPRARRGPRGSDAAADAGAVARPRSSSAARAAELGGERLHRVGDDGEGRVGKRMRHGSLRRRPGPGRTGGDGR